MLVVKSPLSSVCPLATASNNCPADSSVPVTVALVVTAAGNVISVVRSANVVIAPETAAWAVIVVLSAAALTALVLATAAGVIAVVHAAADTALTDTALDRGISVVSTEVLVAAAATLLFSNI